MIYNGNVQPETVVEILKLEGTIVTLDQATMILTFMYQLASIAQVEMEEQLSFPGTDNLFLPAK